MRLMRLSRAYIISWLGNKEIANSRKEVLHKVVAWCKKKNLQPCIIAMQWEEGWYSEFSEIEFIKVPYQMHPGHARNIGLNHFYCTEDDYCVLLDDDTWIAEGDDVIDWFQKASAEDCKDFWMCMPVEIGEHGFEPSETHHIFNASHRFWSGCFIVKNIPKYTEMKELFFNPSYSFDEHGLMHGEDGNFGMRAYSLGLQPWEIKSSIVCKERAKDQVASTWLDGTIKDMQERRGEALSHVLAAKEFKESKNGILLTPQGPAMIPVVTEFRIEKQK